MAGSFDFVAIVVMLLYLLPLQLLATPHQLQEDKHSRLLASATSFSAANSAIPGHVCSVKLDAWWNEYTTDEDVIACMITFQQAMQRVTTNTSGWGLQLHIGSAVPVCCPPRCLQLLYNSSSAAAVYGSYPYSGDSSICLSAIHSGLVSNEDGGWVFYNLFPAYHQPFVFDFTDPAADPSHLLVNGSYQQQAVNISMLELFPYNSSSPSYSNGVHSQLVSLHVNVTMMNYSFTVHGRGTHAGQRQYAPWTGRAGHTQAYWVLGPDCRSFHLIVGGHNDTHYMNDVWIGEQLHPNNYLQSCPTPPSFASAQPQPSAAPGFVQWYRLRDAPFTPRAYMLYTDNVLLGLNTSASAAFVGGQTRHSCDLRQLGRCSDEVWLLNITANSSSPSIGLSVNWTSLPSLPFSARCGSAGAKIPRDQSQAHLPLIVLGGHLSYENDSCLSPLIYVNDLWSNADISNPLSWQHSLAPFSPRSGIIAGWGPPTPQFLVFMLYYGGLLTVYGGVTYKHSVNATTGIAVLSAATMYADAYICRQAYNFSGQCTWSRSDD